MTIPDEQRVGSLIAEKLRVELIVDARSSSLLLLATDQYTGARVLVHLVRPQLTKDQDAVRLMLDDARAASTLGHPNIAGITELGFEPDGGVFMVLEPMSGETLTGLFTRAGGALGAQYGVDLLLPIVGAMSAVHRQGRVHGDIRPENIFLTYDAAGRATAKLFGFGLARVHDAYARLSGPGQIAGNPYYMSPEEARAETGGPASDVWSLGVVLYQAVSGRLPFDAQDAATMLQAISSVPARPLLHVAPQTPPAVAQAIDRAIIADRAVRYSDMTQIHGALAAAVSPPPARPASTPPPAAAAAAVEPEPDVLDEPEGDPLASTVAADPPSGPIELPPAAEPAMPTPAPPPQAPQFPSTQGAHGVPGVPGAQGARPATPSFPHASPPPRPAPHAQAGMARTMEMTPQEAEMLRGLQSQAMSLSTPPSNRPPSGPIATAAPAVQASAWPPASTPAPPMWPASTPAPPMQPAKKGSALPLVLGLLVAFIVLGGAAGVAAWWFVVRANDETGDSTTVVDAGAITPPPPPTAPLVVPPSLATDDAGVAELLSDAGLEAPTQPAEAIDAGPAEAPPPEQPPEQPSAEPDAGPANVEPPPSGPEDAGSAQVEPDEPERPSGPSGPRGPTKRRPRRGGPLIRRTW